MSKNDTVGHVEYLQDLSDGWLRISDFHISCIGLIYFRQVNGRFGQVVFTIHLPDGQVHSIWNFEAWYGAVKTPSIFAKILIIDTNRHSTPLPNNTPPLNAGPTTSSFST